LKGKKNVNESQIFEALNEQRELIDTAKLKSKRARRQAQRNKIHAQKVTPASPNIEVESNPASFQREQPITVLSDLEDGDITGYGEIA
jgi:putative transposase